MAATVSQLIKARDAGRVVTAYAGQAILKGTLLLFDPNSLNRVVDGSSAALTGTLLSDGVSFIGVAKDDYPSKRPGRTGTTRDDASPVEIYTEGVFEFNITGLQQNEEWQVVAVLDNNTVQNYVVGALYENGGVPCGILVERLSVTKGLVMISPSRFFQFQDNDT